MYKVDLLIISYGEKYFLSYYCNTYPLVYNIRIKYPISWIFSLITRGRKDEIPEKMFYFQSEENTFLISKRNKFNLLAALTSGGGP